MPPRRRARQLAVAATLAAALGAGTPCFAAGSDTIDTLVELAD